MREIIDLLSLKQKKILAALGLLVFLSLLFYVFFGSGEKNAYIRRISRLQTVNKELKKIRSDTIQKEQDLSLWNEAVKDMEEMRQQYFYKESDLNTQLRRDLQEIFDKVRLYSSAIKYDYLDLEIGDIKKVKATFEVSGDYPRLKSFIHSLENIPRFLMIERVDFLDIDTQTGGFKLGISLAGYYGE